MRGTTRESLHAAHAMKSELSNSAESAEPATVDAREYAMTEPVADLRTDRIADICRAYHVKELSIFGSVLTDRYQATSDIDILVVFESGVEVGFLTLARLQRELSTLYRRPVDLVPKTGLKPAIRDSVLAEAQVIYAA